MRNKILIIILIILGIIFSVIILGSNSNQLIAFPKLFDEKIAKCLGENAILYISNGCPHCHRQIEIFGENAKYLNIIDCRKEPNKCLEEGIIGVPTWIINGEKYRGVQSIEELIELSNCLYA